MAETTALQTTKSNGLQISVAEDALAQVDAIVRQCSLLSADGANRLKQGLLMAAGIRALKSLLSDAVMQDIMLLQGTRLGFRTDKDNVARDKEGNTGYPVEVVRNCVIEALLNGVYVVGNQFNIIAGGTYITKEGFTQKLEDFPGLTDLELDPEVPRMAGEKGAIVKYSARWKLNGQPSELIREIPVKVNSGMGADAILGKAERKIRAAIWQRVSGKSVADGDVDGSDVVIDAKPAPKSLDDLTKKSNGSEPKPDPQTGLFPGETVDQGGEISGPEDTEDLSQAAAPPKPDAESWRDEPLIKHVRALGPKNVNRVKSHKIETLGQLYDALTAGETEVWKLETTDLERLSTVIDKISTECQLAAAGIE